MSFAAIGVSFLLLVANGFFVAAEFAFTASNRHEVASRPGRAARAAVASMDELSFTLAGAQLGITVMSLLLGYVAEPAVSSILEGVVTAVVEIPDGVLHTISFIISLSIVVFLHMVIGEMAPKNIAITTPERAAVLLALPFRAYATVFRPLIRSLDFISNLGLRAVGISPADPREVHTADDLASMITAGRKEGVVEEFAHRMLTGAIDLGGLDAQHVMVPRPDVIALPVESTPAQLERVIVEAGHTRIPIFRGDIDDVVGFVHAKDLLSLTPEAFDSPMPEDMIRPLAVVPETAAVDRLLEEMRRSRNQIALIVDEHGGTAGIVTVEDIVEEIVGEIRDEHDTESDGMRKVASNRFLVDASLRPNEVTRSLGIAIPDGEYETIGGLVMDRIGRIPEVGDHVDGPGWRIRVSQMEGRRVAQVELIVKREQGPNG